MCVFFFAFSLGVLGRLPTFLVVFVDRLQGFEWYQAGGGNYYNWLKGKAEELGEAGVTSIWIPPPTKATGPGDVGYGIYDLWDLGEFNQKGGVATKWGTKQQLISLISTLKANGIETYIDTVLNHRAASDYSESFTATEVQANNRLKAVGDPYTITAHTGFDFAARKGKYSNLKMNHTHFKGVNKDVKTGKSSIWLIKGHEWATDVSDEQHNYDYLFFADVDHSVPAVHDDVIKWGKWLLDTTGAAGFRLDAVKHFARSFTADFVHQMRLHTGNSNLFFVGEYWYSRVEPLKKWLKALPSSSSISLFDAPLHYNFYHASKSDNIDLRTIFNGSLVLDMPTQAVTFVENHDTQPTQALQSSPAAWFKPLAYSLILLRDAGYPCLFGGDLWGINTKTGSAPIAQLLDFVRARKYFGYGRTTDYFDSPTSIGWTRAGDDNHDPVAVILCGSGKSEEKKMQVPGGAARAGEVWTDALGWSSGSVTVGRNGWTVFKCSAKSVSIWTKTNARGREKFSKAQTY
ncbi:hypothetical protein JCM11641_003278 [Rhodosporidiobolus odoratus]